MDKKKLSFEDLLKSDPLGLLKDVKPKATTAHTEDERLVQTFEEINAFYEKNKREPATKPVSEWTLFSRLKGIRNNPTKINQLLKYDRFNLLKETGDKAYDLSLDSPNEVAEPAPEPIKKTPPPIEIKSIEDILNNDLLGILDTAKEEESLFTLKHVKKQADRAEADFVAQRKACKDFDKYESLFKACQADLKTGKRKLVKFHERQLQEGAFFVLKGVMCYLVRINDLKKDKNYKVDGRTLIIFENGTESNMLLRSLGKGLFEDGWGVTFPDDENTSKLAESAAAITEEDKLMGYIYIVRSKSKDPVIASINNLYKIGYASTTVSDRLKNAEKEPTYLMAPVHLLSTYKVYNTAPNKLESLLHRFFGNACLDVNLYDSNEQLYRPREWFVAPLDVIEQAVRFILNGEIVKYRYDLERGEIVGR